MLSYCKIYPQNEDASLYRALHQVTKETTIKGSIAYRTLHQVPKVTPIEGFHCRHPTMTRSPTHPELSQTWLAAAWGSERKRW